MSAPPSASQATGFPAPSFEDFSSVVLAQWTNEAERTGLVVTSARVAAARAAFEATVEHAGRQGTVLVVAHDASSARSCFDYLKAFFTDQAQLASLTKVISADTITLRAGPRILVTSDATRRPKGLLASVALVQPHIADEVSPRDLMRCCFSAASQGPAVAAEIEDILALAHGWFAAFHLRHKAEVDEDFRMQQQARSGARQKSPTSVPVVPRLGQPINPEPVDGRDHFSPEWELNNSFRKEMGGHRKPVVRHSRPGDAR